MKRKTAKEILADSFRELAGTKAIDKITVKDITDNCGYSTATFYRQFTDKYDLIAWEYTSTAWDPSASPANGSWVNTTRHRRSWPKSIKTPSRRRSDSIFFNYSAASLLPYHVKSGTPRVTI